MDIFVLSGVGANSAVAVSTALGLSLVLLPLHAVPKILETHTQLISMVQEDVCDNCRVNCKEEAVKQSVGSAHVWRGVCRVLLLVIHTTRIDRSRYIIKRTEVIIDSVTVDREIASVPCVCVPDCEDEEPGDEHATGSIEGTERRHHLSHISLNEYVNFRNEKNLPEDQHC